MCKHEIEILGHTTFAKQKIGVMKNKVTAVQLGVVCKTQPELRFFLGLASYYRRFIPKFATIGKPLHDLASLFKREDTVCKKQII